MDVHQATISVAVMDDKGKLIMESCWRPKQPRMRSAPSASAASRLLHAMPPRITRNSDRPRAWDRTMVDLVLLAASFTLEPCHQQQRNAYENGQPAKPLQGNDTEWAGSRERTSSSGRGELFFLTSLFIELIDSRPEVPHFFSLNFCANRHSRPTRRPLAIRSST